MDSKAMNQKGKVVVRREEKGRREQIGTDRIPKDIGPQAKAPWVHERSKTKSRKLRS